MKKLYILFLLLFTTQSLATMMCEGATDFYALYEISTYTCASGYYLPANTDGCQPCPTGFTCGGGTFTFNPDIYQGAILDTVTTSTMNNVCADNFPTDFYAIYEPNTVSLTWDDGFGNTTTNTCTYDGAITLPPTPTRAGYTFTGWTVQSSNE